MEHHSHPMTRRPLAIARGFYGASLASHDPLAVKHPVRRQGTGNPRSRGTLRFNCPTGREISST